MIPNDSQWYRMIQSPPERFWIIQEMFQNNSKRFKLILKMIQSDSETNSEWIPNDSQWSRIIQTLMDVCSAWCSTSISGLNCKSGPAPRKSLSAFLLPTNIERCSLYGGYYLLCLCVFVGDFLSRKHDCDIKSRRQTNQPSVRQRFTPPAATTARWFNAGAHSSDWLFTVLPLLCSVLSLKTSHFSLRLWRCCQEAQHHCVLAGEGKDRREREGGQSRHSDPN